MKILLNPGKQGDVIVTVAIGDKYLSNWIRFASPLWKKYCERHDLGLVLFDADLIPIQDPHWKKPNWQKLLVGKPLIERFPNIRKVCYLDSDILINPHAPNVFSSHDDGKVGLTSLRNNLPYTDLHELLRRISFFRHRFYSSQYPLDSAIFISDEDLYKYHNLPPQPDVACTGFMVFDIESAQKMENVFMKYPKGVASITGGGEQTHLNYEIQSSFDVQWFDYRFQAIWNYEMAAKYPFLYIHGQSSPDIVRWCVEASLLSNYFLHFAGSWNESDMWKIDRIFHDDTDWVDAYYEYLKVDVSGKPVGLVKPS